MKRLLTVLSAALMITAFAGATASKTAGKTNGPDDAKKPVTNKKCPVSGTDVNPGIRLEYEGQFVYFCCQDCPADFQKDPAKYIANLSPEDRQAVKINEKCPVTGDAIDKSMWVEYEGRKIYFCCPNCVAAFKKDHKVTETSKAASDN